MYNLLSLSLGLRELHLDNLADRVDSFSAGDDAVDSVSYHSRIREKKVRKLTKN